MGAWAKGLVGAALLLIAAFVSLIYGLYWYGAAALPRQLPLPKHTYSDDLRSEYWASIDGRGPIAVDRLDPLKVCWDFYRMTETERPGRPDPRWQLLTPMARQIAYDAEAQHPATKWHLTNIAAAIRLSQERSAEQIVDLTLEHAWMGRDAKGMHQAALAYYGVPLDQLTRPERISLIALLYGPSYYDPSRNPERFRKRYAMIAQKAGVPFERINPEHDLARLIPAR